jgi:GPH family glycoside/pentoside/hexuronide:cation symporter
MNWQKSFGYAIGDLGINLFFISSMTFLLYFYTDVLEISAGAAAGVLLVARLVDAVTDPIMGAIAERTRTRWGRLRPYLLLGSIPLGVVAVLTFTVPELDESGRVIWAYVTYIAFGILYTVVTIPYSALTASLTDDYEVRTKLSTWRMGCAFAGAAAVTVGVPELVPGGDFLQHR